MEKEERMKTAREWLKIVRGEGDAQSKRAYLLGKGLEEGEVSRVLEEDEADRAAGGRLGEH